MKTLRDMLCGAILTFAAVFAAASFGAVGTPPGTGPGVVDGAWLTGLANGRNFSYQNGITAAGTTQATGTQLSSGIVLVQIGTAAASTGVNLPQAYQGTALMISNAGANTVTVYPTVPNNPITAAQDTINAGTSTTIASNASKLFFSPKDGVWAAQ